MRMIFRTLLLWTLILGACSTGGFSPEVSSPAPPTDTPSPSVIPVSTTQVLPLTKLIATLATPHIDQPPDGNVTTAPPTFEGCAYMWAYKDLPELSGQLQEEIQALDPGATAWATAFGEDCIRSDGRVDFLVRETDFYVHRLVTDPTDFESFGNWILQVMQTIEALPDEAIVGPIPGFVEFWFIENEAEHLVARVPFEQYREEAGGKTGEELFRMFYVEP